MSDPARKNWEAFNEAFDAGHQKYIELADKCDRFYNSEQWDEATLAALGDRPAVTLNFALRSINAILGHYSTQRADIIFKPRKTTTEEQARLMSMVVDSIMEHNHYQFLEGMMFSDGIITDRGFMDIRLDFEGNMLGEVQYTSKDPRSIIIDPFATEYDPAKWNEVITTEWWTPEDIELMYGKEKAQELQAVVDLREDWGTRSIRFGSPNVGGTDRAIIRAVNVIDRQYRRLTKVREFVDLETGDIAPIPMEWDRNKISAVLEKMQGQLGVRERMAKRVRWTVSCDHITLFDEWSPYDEFTIVPYFPFFRRGKPAGVMRHLLSPQELLNKSKSQELHIVNTSANSGWTVEAGSLVNMTEAELEERGAETGLVLVYARGKQPPQKIEANQIPTGIAQLARDAQGFITEIPGTGPLVGMNPKSDISGVTLDTSRGIALGGLQPIFDNLNFTRQLIAHRTVKLVQRFYTEPRVLRMTDWRAPEAVGVEFDINTDMLNNITLGEYDITATSAPARDTYEETQFAQAIELRNAGVTIPDHYVILSSHLAQKKEIAEIVKRLQGLAEPSEEEVAMNEMQQQLLIRKAMLDLAELEAKVRKLRAEAGLAEVKAVVEGRREGEGAGLRLEMERLALDRDKLVADLQKKAADLMNKLELADKHIAAKMQVERYKAVGKRMDNDARLRGDLAREAARGLNAIAVARAKPEPAAKPAFKK